MSNAIILAAGKSSRFAPFTYEKPKGLFRVKGEILIERQIEQLREAGVEEIYVVVGYMKEKFFYLEQKYPGLRLIVNNEFGKKGNLYTVYIARQYLADTFICCADHYFYVSRETGIDQVIDDANAVNADERLRGVESDRNKAGAESGGNEDGAFCSIWFQRFQALVGDGRIADKAFARQFFHDAINCTQTVIGQLFKVTL